MVKNRPLRSLWEAEKWPPKMSTVTRWACGRILCCGPRSTEDGLNKGLGMGSPPGLSGQAHHCLMNP